MSTRADVITATQNALAVAEALPPEVTPAPMPGPTPPPPASAPIIGMNNLMSAAAWGSGGHAAAIRAVLRTKYDRIPTSGVLTWVKTAVANGFDPLVIWTGSVAAYQAAVAELVKLGITRVEWQNEDYLHGQTGAGDAALYGQALKVTPSSITLIADTRIGNGSQADTEAWIAAHGTEVQEWSVHLYSREGAGWAWADTNTPAGPGLATLPKLLPMLKGKPLNLTEYGEPTAEGSDHVKAVSPEEQANGMQAMIEAAVALPLRSAYWFEAVDSGEGAYGVLNRSLEWKLAGHRMGETLGRLGLASA